MPLINALRALHKHRYEDPTLVLPPKEELPEFESELGTVKSIIESLVEDEDLPEEKKEIEFQRRIDNQRRSFISDKAVQLINKSCKEAEVPLSLKVFKIHKK